MMTTRFPRFTPLRSVGYAAVAGALVLAACEKALPSAAEVEQMDVAAAEAGAQRAGFVVLKDDPHTTYMVDGVEVSPAEARALNPEQIAAIEVSKDAAGARIMITTPEALAARGESLPDDGRRIRVSGTGIDGEPVRRIRIRGDAGEVSASSATVEGFDGIFVIDGKQVDPKEMRKLAPGAVANVEILKGAAAAAQFSDPAAAKGVIRITTKKAAGAGN